MNFKLCEFQRENNKSSNFFSQNFSFAFLKNVFAARIEVCQGSYFKHLPDSFRRWGRARLPQWSRLSGGLASAWSGTTTIGLKECFSILVFSEIEIRHPLACETNPGTSQKIQGKNASKGMFEHQRSPDCKCYYSRASEGKSHERQQRLATLQ
jgi:hypothetical protein